MSKPQHSIGPGLAGVRRDLRGAHRREIAIRPAPSAAHRRRLTRQIRSTTIATPIPPPTHSDATPYRACRCAQRVDERRQHARAARADRVAERDGAAVDVHARRIDAELAHDRERLRGEGFVQLEEIDLSTRQPRALERRVTAGTGPMPMTFGSTPVVAYARMRASGAVPICRACLAVVTTSAAAPSLMPEALPAVTVRPS